jgi:protein O-mannosyl-transferase
MAKKQSPSSKLQPITSHEIPEKTNPFLWCFGVLLLTFLTFLPSLKNGFVNWDDPDNLYENKNLEVFRSPADLKIANFKPIFKYETGRVLGNFNPLPIATFAVEKAYFGTKITDPKTGKSTDNGFPFHLTNLLLHLVVVFFSFKILINIGISPIGAAVGAALMGVHPMRVESVAWVTERKDVLFGAFFFAALFYYSKWSKRAVEGHFSPILYVLLLILMAVGGMAKVQMVTLPLSMLAIDFWQKRAISWRLLLEKAPFFALSLYFGYLNVVGLTDSKSLDDSILGYSMVDRLAVGAWSYFTYLYKLFAPYPMSPLYPYPSKMPWYSFAAMLPVLAIAGWWFWSFSKNKSRAMVFAVFFFTANIIFLLQIKAAGQGYLADRFTYVAYFGFFAFAAWLFDRFFNKESSKNLAISIASAVLLIFGFATFKQQKIWKNGEALWSHDSLGKSSPNFP